MEEIANSQGKMRKEQRSGHLTIASELRGLYVEKCKENKEFPFFFSSLLLSFSTFFLCFFFQQKGQQPKEWNISNITQIANS